MSAALMAAAVAAIVAVDQWSKLWTVANFELGEGMAFLPPILALRRVHNYGAAWSSFSGARWFLIIVTAVGMLALCYLLWRIVRHPLGRWSLVAVIGGGVGNLIDRVRLGYVVDMLEVTFIDFPVFNVADCFVVCGTILAALYYLFYYEKYDAKNWEKKDGTDPSDRG